MVSNAFKECSIDGRRLRNAVIDGTEYEMLWADTDKKTFASGSGLLQLACFKFSFFPSELKSPLLSLSLLP